MSSRIVPFCQYYSRQTGYRANAYPLRAPNSVFLPAPRRGRGGEGVYNRTMVDFIYVADEASLRGMLEDLRGHERLSVDLESDSFHHYQDRIALLQLGSAEKTYIIDPFAVDVSALTPFFKDKGVEKVFHDADYDGRMILTATGVKPAPVFDTMVAARMLGKTKFGLADLLWEYFGVELDKALQREDWSRRPLGEEMLRYAARDVAYLLSLRDRLAEELEEAGRLEWAREEFADVVEGLEPMPPKKTDLRRVKGARDLEGRQLSVLQALLEWRDERARRKDLPPFKVVGTERLLRLATEMPRSRRRLESCGALSPRQLAMFGEEILRAIEEGAGKPPSDWPRFPAPERNVRDMAAEKLLRRFKAARDRRAAELGLDPGFLLPNAALKELARLKPRELADMERSGLLKGWRLKVMGEALAECLAG